MPAPICLAMVVCDGHYRDPFTNKRTLIGTFSTLSGETFPIVHPHITINVALTDGRGHVPVLLEMVDADEERPPLIKFEGSVTFADPRHVIDMCFQTGVISIPEPGEYRLRLFAGGEFILERKIFAGPPIPVDQWDLRLKGEHPPTVLPVIGSA